VRRSDEERLSIRRMRAYRGDNVGARRNVNGSVAAVSRTHDG